MEATNMWSLNVTPVQRKFTFPTRTQYDWIKNRGHTYKNTTHQNIIMHYLKFIFLNCTAVMPPRIFFLPFDVSVGFSYHLHSGKILTSLMSSWIKHSSLYLLKKKTAGILINYGLGLKLSLFQQFLIKVKNQQIKYYQRLCIQYYKIKNMLGTVNRLQQFWHDHTIFFYCIKNQEAYIKIYKTYNACFLLLYSLRVRQFLVQIVIDVHSEIHIDIQWCVNCCSTWTKTGTLINFSRFPNKKFSENLYRGLSSYMQIHKEKQPKWS